MTAKKGKMQGRKVTREEALKGLGDPATWQKAFTLLDQAMRQPYPRPTATRTDLKHG